MNGNELKHFKVHEALNLTKIDPVELELPILEESVITEFRTSRVRNYMSDKLQLDEDISLIAELKKELSEADADSLARIDVWIQNGRSQKRRPEGAANRLVQIYDVLPSKQAEVENLRARCLFHLHMIQKFDKLLEDVKQHKNKGNA